MRVAGVGCAMLSWAWRAWRVLATGVSFFLFGAGGLVLRIAVFPLIHICIREKEARTRLSRIVIRFAMRAFVEFMRAVGILRYELRGMERLDRQGLLILANHPTLIDTVFLMAFVKHAGCIVKNSLWENPFTHGPVRAADYINNSSGPELIERCIAALKTGSNLIVFPEGTRTPRNGELNFKRGAANVAVRGRWNVTPVVIRCTPPTLSKGEKWWHVPVRRFDFSMEVREDIAIQRFLSEADNETVAARQLTHYLEDYFSRENQGHAIA